MTSSTKPEVHALQPRQQSTEPQANLVNHERVVPGACWRTDTWLRGTVVERWYLAGELSLCHSRLAADG